MSDGGEDMQSETEASLEEFLSSGRTGRRNALADVADAKLAEVSVAGLSGDFSGIAVQGFCLLRDFL